MSSEMAKYLSELKSEVDHKNDAIVVLSGGQDSTTCLYLASMIHPNVRAVNFFYGQRHNEEIEAASKVCSDLNVELILIDVSFFKNITSALIQHEKDLNLDHDYKPDLPASFVPGRNALFLTMAHAIAQEHNAKTIYTGVCQTDYSGYPDCRQKFIALLESALNAGYETDITISTPLMYLSKADTFAIACHLNFLDVIINDTITCYEGKRIGFEYGYGCGECPACKLRAKGYREFIADKHRFI